MKRLNRKERDYMRKIISLLLALSLLMCMGVSAIAAENNINPAAESDNIITSETSAVSEGSEEIPKSEIVSESNVPDESVTSEQTKESDESAVPEDTNNTENSTVVEDSGQPEGDTTLSEGDEIDSQEILDTSVDGEPMDEGVMPIADSYSVNISWTGMVFTYTAASNGRWDPNPNVFAYVDKGQKGTWQSSDGKGYGTFTVKINHEMTETIRVSFQFVKNSTDEDAFVPALRMKFSKSTSMSPVTFDTGELYFYSTDQSKEQKLYAVPSILSVTPDDFGGEGKQKKLGTVTISIAVVDDSEWQDPIPEQPEIGDLVSPEQPGIE